MFKHFLVPTDGSQHAQDSVRRVISFAREAGAQITAFYAKPEYQARFVGIGALKDSTSPDDYISPDKFDALAEADAQKILAFVETLCLEGGVPCTKKTLTNDKPYLGIIEAATSFLTASPQVGLSREMADVEPLIPCSGIGAPTSGK